MSRRRAQDKADAIANDWKESMAAALAAAGVSSQTEFVEKYPGKHCWFDFHGTPSCANCGVVRRYDDNNKPCRGIVTIGLRGTET